MTEEIRGNHSSILAYFSYSDNQLLKAASGHQKR